MMYLCLFAGAIANAMGWPARSALLPQIVPGEVFSNAATWNSSAFQVAAMVGPALGGAIITQSVPAAYLIDAGLSLTFLFLLMQLHVQAVARPREPISMQSLAAGIRFVWRTKIILATITLDLFAVLFGGAVALIPAYAQDILHVGSVGFGWLRGAPAIGALLMALWIAHRPPMQKAGRNMLWAVAGFGIGTIIFGLSHSFWLSFLMLLLTGACDNVSVVVRHTLVQMLTPDGMRGRVSAVNNVFIGASNELGAFESGVVGRFLGAVWSVVIGGIGTLVVVGAVAVIWPQVRGFGSLQDAKPEEEPIGVGQA
jgi:MFS family permease